MTGADYTPTGMEIGHPAWDISQILTRHANKKNGDAVTCDKVHSLLSTIGENARTRLDMAVARPCTCGVGSSLSELTTYRKEEKAKCLPDQQASSSSDLAT